MFTIHIRILLRICIRIIYVFRRKFIRQLFTIHYSLFTINYLLFTIYYLLFTINYLLFNIYYLLLTIYYLGENPYLMEFDETPIFWYPRVARDVWIDLTFCSDQF